MIDDFHCTNGLERHFGWSTVDRGLFWAVSGLTVRCQALLSLDNLSEISTSLQYIPVVNCGGLP